jgi:spermidine synthase
MSMITRAWLVSALVGFASLGQEMLWMRIVSFANGNTPQTFSLVLSLFLLGIALGAVIGKRACTNNNILSITDFGALTLALSGIIDLISPWLIITASGGYIVTPLLYLLILATSTSKAVLFPIVHHLGSNLENDAPGRSIGIIYFSNIIGASLAPLLIGFWWLDIMSSQALMMSLGGITMIASAMLATHRILQTTATIAGFMTLVFMIALPNQTTLLEALIAPAPGFSIGFLIENRHGVIHTLDHNTEGETVFGGNIYDGKINIDLIRNSNRVDRVYLLAALHPHPRRILVVGLSGGSWTRVLSEFPEVERIDVVEINPGYIDLIQRRSEVSSILNNHRVHIHIDDGRRWLRRNNETRFDIIVMNTTFHWRAHSTSLLSMDFMKIIKSHLQEGGIFAFNATGSPDALKTAAHVFRFAYRWKGSNFIYASEHDFTTFKTEAARQRLNTLLTALEISQRHDIAHVEQSINKILEPQWINAQNEEENHKRQLEIITDQNMITEYRSGRTAW